MKNTYYTFTINGHKYSASGDNRFDAQTAVEFANGISLKGAKFEVIFKLRVIRTGTVK